MMSYPKGLTKTQKRLYDKLKGGQRIPNDELMLCLEDEQAGPTALAAHMSDMRESLKNYGLEIVGRGGYYQLLRFIASPNKE